MTNHPITPPPELVQHWWEEADQHVDRDDPKTYFDYIATQAARWGADQELEACIEYFHEYDASWGEHSDLVTGLRTTRRPKPPSLKEQALKELKNSEMDMSPISFERIRHALEQLPD